MKRVMLLIILAVFTLSLTNAQELTNKKGEIILPKQGDVVLGFDAVPVVDFALNVLDIMTSSGQTAQHPGYVSGYSGVLVGKYFLKDNVALRVRFGLNTSSTATSDYFYDPKDILDNPGEPDQWGLIKDVTTTSGKDFFVGAGLEFRRGHNRLQGFCGAELFLGASSSSIAMKYAIAMSEEALTNAYTNADGSLVVADRLIQSRTGNALVFGARGFVGVEYFVAPKISLAAEFGWGFGVITTPRGSITQEIFNSETNEGEEETIKGFQSSVSSGFHVDDGFSRTLGGSAALSILFHF